MFTLKIVKPNKTEKVYLLGRDYELVTKKDSEERFERLKDASNFGIPEDTYALVNSSYGDIIPIQSSNLSLIVIETVGRTFQETELLP